MTASLAARREAAKHLGLASGHGTTIPESTFSEKKGGVYGELSPGAFPKLVEVLTKHKLWLDSDNVCLDFGHGFGRFAAGSLLESDGEHRCEWMGIELVQERHAEAVELKKQLIEEELIDNEELEFHVGDFMSLPDDHPVIVKPTVVIGYDVWIYAAAQSAHSKDPYRQYANQLVRMPNLRALVTCCHRNKDMTDILSDYGFDLKAKLALPTRGNELQTALVFARRRSSYPSHSPSPSSSSVRLSASASASASASISHASPTGRAKHSAVSASGSPSSPGGAAAAALALAEGPATPSKTASLALRAGRAQAAFGASSLAQDAGTASAGATRSGGSATTIHRTRSGRPCSPTGTGTGRTSAPSSLMSSSSASLSPTALSASASSPASSAPASRSQQSPWPSATSSSSSSSSSASSSSGYSSPSSSSQSQSFVAGVKRPRGLMSTGTGTGNDDGSIDSSATRSLNTRTAHHDGPASASASISQAASAPLSAPQARSLPPRPARDTAAAIISVLTDLRKAVGRATGTSTAAAGAGAMQVSTNSLSSPSSSSGAGTGSAQVSGRSSVAEDVGSGEKVSARGTQAARGSGAGAEGGRRVSSHAASASDGVKALRTGAGTGARARTLGIGPTAPALVAACSSGSSTTLVIGTGTGTGTGKREYHLNIPYEDFSARLRATAAATGKYVYRFTQ